MGKDVITVPDVQRVIANAVVWAAGEQEPMYPDRSINSPTGWFE